MIESGEETENMNFLRTAKSRSTRSNPRKKSGRDAGYRHERSEILRAAARAAFVQEWASRVERDVEDGRRKRTPYGAGDDIMDFAPKRTPASANKWAKEMIAKVEKLSKEDIVDLYHRLEAEPGHRRSPTLEDFGHYIAMQAVGHGVSWGDDHPDDGLEVPYMEYYG